MTPTSELLELPPNTTPAHAQILRLDAGAGRRQDLHAGQSSDGLWPRGWTHADRLAVGRRPDCQAVPHSDPCGQPDQTVATGSRRESEPSGPSGMTAEPLLPSNPDETNQRVPVPGEARFSPGIPATDIDFRHSGWARDRSRVEDSLTAVFGIGSRLERFRECGAHAWVLQSQEDPHLFRVAASHCRDRFCVPCAREHAQLIGGNLRAHLQERPFRLLTLTIRTKRLGLKEAVNKLYDAFRQLRRSALWRRCVTGGVAICDIKRSRDGVSWHPHLHCILEGKYLPQAAVSEVWRAITLDSYVVDIRHSRNVHHATNTVTRYLTKPIDAQVLRDPAALQAAMRALHGRRLALTFGSWRGLRLCDPPPTGEWRAVCPLSKLLKRAATGEPDALRLVSHLQELDPCLRPRPPTCQVLR